MTRITLAAAVMALGLACGCAERTMLEKASHADQRLFAELKPIILAEAAKPPLVLGESHEGYFWLMSARLVPLMKAYAYSKDPAFLEAFVPLMEQVLSQRYVHPTKPEWSAWWPYKDGDATAILIDHDAILHFVPVLMFVQEVRSDPKLREQYGATAEGWFKDVERSIRAWDKRNCWHDLGPMGGWYTNMTHVPDTKTGRLVKRTSIHAGGTTPYNKIHALFEALSLAYRLTGDPWYRERIEKCCTFFQRHWRVDAKHAEWNYRDHEFPGDFVSGAVGKGRTRTGAFIHPKGGYYALDVQGTVTAYDLGVFYSRKHIEKLLQTNLEFMWMGDQKDPKFRKISGTYKAEGKYDKGYLWTALAHFSPKVRDLWKVQLDQVRSSKRWMWWAATLDYLIEMSQPVAWEPRHTKDIPRPGGRSR